MQELLRQLIIFIVNFFLVFQLCLSPFMGYTYASSQLTPAVTGTVKGRQLPFPIQTYVIKKKDRLEDIARRYNIKLRALVYLNDDKISVYDRTNLRPGDVIIVPKKPLSNKVSRSLDAAISSNNFHKFAQKGVGLLKGDTSIKAMAFGKAQDLTSQLGTQLSVWAGQYGTANIDFSLQSKMGGGYEILPQMRLLLPFWDVKHAIVFGQASYHRTDERNQVNFGVGGRYFFGNLMLGLNSFADYDLTGNHFRLGAGAEFWLDYFKLATNGYFGMNNSERVSLSLFEAKAATGYDVRADFYLPKMPAFGVSASYERYFGAIDLKNSKVEGSLISDPHGLTLGINYTPVPLLTFSVDGKISGSFREDLFYGQTRLGLQANYRLGVPLSEQLRASNVEKTRRISGNRYDLVARNDNIVLSYKKRYKISLKQRISGFSGEIKSIFDRVEKVPTEARITWDIPPELKKDMRNCNEISTLQQCKVTLPLYRKDGNNRYHLHVSLSLAGKVFFDGMTEISVDPVEILFSQDKDRTSISDPEGITLSLHLKDTNFQGKDYDDKIHFEFTDENGKKTNSIRIINSFSKISSGFYKQTIGSTAPGIYFAKAILDKETGFSLTNTTLKLNFTTPKFPDKKSKISLESEEIWSNILGSMNKAHETKVVFHPISADGKFLYLGEEMAFKLNCEGVSPAITIPAERVNEHYEAKIAAILFTDKNYAPREGAYIIKVTPHIKGLKLEETFSTHLKLHKLNFDAKQWVSGFKAGKDALYFNEKTFIHVALKDNIEVSAFAKDLRVAFVDQVQKASEDATMGVLTNSSDNAYKAEFFAGCRSKAYKVGLYYKDKLLRTVDIKVYDPSMSFENSKLFVDRISSHVPDKQGILLKLVARDSRNAPLTGAADQIGFTLKGSDGTVDVYKTLEGFKETSPGIYSLRVGSDKALSYEVVAYKRLSDGSKLYMTDKAQKISFVSYIMQAKLSSDRDNVSITDKKGMALRLTLEDPYGAAAQQDYSGKLSFVIKDEQGRSGNARVLSALKRLSNNIYEQFISAKTAGTYHVEVNSSIADFAIADNHLVVNFAKASLPSQGSMSLAEKELWWDELGNKGKPHETKVIYAPKHSDGTFAYLGEEIEFKLMNEGGPSVFVRAHKVADHYEALIKTSLFKSKDYTPRDKAYTINIIPFISGLDFPSNNGTALTLHRPVLSSDDWILDFKADKDALHFNEKSFIHVTLKNNAEIKEFVKNIRIGFVDKASQGDNKLGHLVQQSDNAYRADFIAGTKVGSFKIGLFYGNSLLKDVSIKVSECPKFSEENSTISFDKLSTYTISPDGITVTFTAKNGCNVPATGLGDRIGFRVSNLDGTATSSVTFGPVKEIEPGVYTQQMKSSHSASYMVTAYQIIGGEKRYYEKKKQQISFKKYELSSASTIDVKSGYVAFPDSGTDLPAEAVFKLALKDEDLKMLRPVLAEINYKGYIDGRGVLKVRASSDGYVHVPQSLLQAYKQYSEKGPVKISFRPEHENIIFNSNINTTVEVYGTLPSRDKISIDWKVESNHLTDDNKDVKFKLQFRRRPGIPIISLTDKHVFNKIFYISYTRDYVDGVKTYVPEWVEHKGEGLTVLGSRLPNIRENYFFKLYYLHGGKKHFIDVVLVRTMPKPKISGENSSLVTDQLPFAYTLSPDGIVIKFLAKDDSKEFVDKYIDQIGFQVTNLDGTHATSIIFDPMIEKQSGVYTQRIRSRSSGSYIVTPYEIVDGQRYYKNKTIEVSFKKYELSSSSKIDVKSGYVAFPHSGTNLPSEAVFKLALSDEDLKMLRPVLKEIDYKGYIDGKEVLKVRASSDGYVHVPQSLLQAYKQYSEKGPVKISFRPEHEHIVFNSKLNTTIEVYGTLPSFDKVSIDWNAEKTYYSDKKDIKFTLGFKTKSGHPIILTDKHDFNKIFYVSCSKFGDFVPDWIERKGDGSYAFGRHLPDNTENYTFKLYYLHGDKFFVKNIFISTKVSPDASLVVKFYHLDSEDVVIGNTKRINFKILSENRHEEVGLSGLTADYEFLRGSSDFGDAGRTKVSAPVAAGHGYFVNYTADRHSGKFYLRIWYNNRLIGKKIVDVRMPANFEKSGFSFEVTVDGQPLEPGEPVTLYFASDQLKYKDVRITLRLRHRDGWYVLGFPRTTLSTKVITEGRGAVEVIQQPVNISSLVVYAGAIRAKYDFPHGAVSYRVRLFISMKDTENFPLGDIVFVRRI